MMLQKVLKYCPDLNPITGSVTASLLMCQLEYWFDKTGDKPFYKFLEPCADEHYKVGDSWVEELGFSAFEFRTAFAKIGKVYKSKTEYMKSKDKFEDKFYLSYYDRMKKRTYYIRNTAALSKLLINLESQGGYSIDYIPDTNSYNLSDRTIVTPSHTQTSSLLSDDTINSSLNATTLSSHASIETPEIGTPSSLVPYDEILELFHRTCPSLPKPSALSPKCKQKMDYLWTYLEQTKQDARDLFKQVFTQVEASDFLCGRTSTSTWRAMLDWILQPKKFFSILKGKYAPFFPRCTPSSSSSCTPHSSSTAKNTQTAYNPKPLHTFLRMENHHFDLEQLEALERAHQQSRYEAKMHNLSLASL